MPGLREVVDGVVVDVRRDGVTIKDKISRLVDFWTRQKRRRTTATSVTAEIGSRTSGSIP